MGIKEECEQYLHELNTEVALFTARGLSLIHAMEQMYDTDTNFVLDYLEAYISIRNRVQTVFWIICQALGDSKVKELQQPINDYANLVGHSLQDSLAGGHKERLAYVREVWRMTMNINNKIKTYCRKHGLSVPGFAILGEDF